MLNKDEAERGLISTSDDLGFILICQRFHESVPICLVSRDVMSKSVVDRRVVSLDLAVGLRMGRRSGEVFTTKGGL